MMRLNAPLPAFLALAVLFLLPATLLAKPVHRRVRKTTAASHQSSKRSSHTTRTTRSRKSASAHVTHVRSHAVKRSRHVTRTKAVSRRPAEQHLDVSDNTPRKATADDFLKAAATKPEPQEEQKAHAEHASRSRSRRSRSVAKSVPVVSVIRPTPEKPQLKSIADDAKTPAVLPVLYNKRGRLIVPPPLKGSHEILLHQNEVADREGLDRIQNDADLLDMRNKRILVPLPASYALEVDDRLPADRRYTRPWTARLSHQHGARALRPLSLRRCRSTPPCAPSNFSSI